MKEEIIRSAIDNLDTCISNALAIHKLQTLQECFYIKSLALDELLEILKCAEIDEDEDAEIVRNFILDNERKRQISSDKFL